MTDLKVAVVVPVHGRLPLTLRFLESFRKVRYANYQIVIVDDASPDNTSAYLASHHPEVIVLSGDGDLWWAGGTNRGVRYALTHAFDYVLTINNDSSVEPDFLSYLVETARTQPRSIVGSRINYLEDCHKVWSVGGYLDWEERFVLLLHENGAEEADVLARWPNPAPVEFLPGCGVLVPAGCFRELGLYDERMFPQYHADSEFTLRAGRRGYRVLVDLRAVVYNDVAQTCRVRQLLSRRSPWYWRPLLALYLRYCPREHRLAWLFQQYGETVLDQLYPALPGDEAPPFIRLRRALRRLRRGSEVDQASEPELRVSVR
jgi:GT2 family glycosyltransferase